VLPEGIDPLLDLEQLAHELLLRRAHLEEESVLLRSERQLLRLHDVVYVLVRAECLPAQLAPLLRQPVVELLQHVERVHALRDRVAVRADGEGDRRHKLAQLDQLLDVGGLFTQLRFDLLEVLLDLLAPVLGELGEVVQLLLDDLPALARQLPAHVLAVDVHEPEPHVAGHLGFDALLVRDLDRDLLLDVVDIAVTDK